MYNLIKTSKLQILSKSANNKVVTTHTIVAEVVDLMKYLMWNNQETYYENDIQTILQNRVLWIAVCAF